MKKILTIGASNSTTSINRTLARYAASFLKGCACESLDLNDFEMPIYSPERESSTGVPNEAQRLVTYIESSAGIILSLAEHNGNYSAAFKNILDWASRHKQRVWSDKPMLLMSTSPGGRGGATVLNAAKTSFPHLGANVISSYSLPSFYSNFDVNEGITNPELKLQLESAVEGFAKAL
ncbi:MAG: hypothetical protein RI897_3384 [Verrucomicrobiota bacterium]|jgi:NAD(P)H-dependent FMN reductase